MEVLTKKTEHLFLNISIKVSELHHLFFSYYYLLNHSSSRTMAINVSNRRSSASSDVSSFAARSTSSADMIRGRFLFKLGIYDPNFTDASIYHKIQHQICFARPINDTFYMQDTTPRQPPSGVGQEVSKDRETVISPFKARYPVPIVPEQASTYADIERLPHLASMNHLSSLSLSRSIRRIRREEPRDQDARGSWHEALSRPTQVRARIERWRYCALAASHVDGRYVVIVANLLAIRRRRRRPHLHPTFSSSQDSQDRTEREVQTTTPSLSTVRSVDDRRADPIPQIVRPSHAFSAACHQG